MNESIGTKSCSIQVCEMYDSISGELGLICPGQWSTFIRLSGCNLNCSYCDTPQALDPNSGVKCDVEKIAEFLTTRPGPRHVLITGGEPMLQEKSVGLLSHLLKRGGMKISIETNGTYNLCELDKTGDIHQWNVDYKSFHPWEGNKAFHDLPLYGKLLVKFVIGGRKDYEKAKHEIMPKIKMAQRHERLIRYAFSACSSSSEPVMHPSILYQWMFEGRDWEKRIEFNPQLHRLMGISQIENEKGHTHDLSNFAYACE